MNKVATDIRPEVEVSAPHVLQAINNVMREIRKLGIAKDRTNTSQNYKFRGIDDVYNVLCGILADNYLVITPKCLNHARDFIATAKGGQAVSAVVMVEYEFASALDGSIKIVGPFPGEANDFADKATNKAMSAAYKYMGMQEFCIPTEGDNDADAHTIPVASMEQRAISHLKACAIDKATFKDAWESNKDAWRKAMADDAYARVVVEMKRLAATLPKDEPKPAPAEDLGISDDDIPEQFR